MDSYDLELNESLRPYKLEDESSKLVRKTKVAAGTDDFTELREAIANIDGIEQPTQRMAEAFGYASALSHRRHQKEVIVSKETTKESTLKVSDFPLDNTKEDADAIITDVIDDAISDVLIMVLLTKLLRSLMIINHLINHK